MLDYIFTILLFMGLASAIGWAIRVARRERDRIDAALDDADDAIIYLRYCFENLEQALDGIAQEVATERARIDRLRAPRAPKTLYDADRRR